jgi:hypothetical protein
LIVTRRRGVSACKSIPVAPVEKSLTLERSP